MKRPLVLSFILLFTALLPAEEKTHILKRGETLYSLAREYGVGYEELLTANGIRDARKLQAGAKIIIPSKTVYSTHRVVRGDTCYSVAREYGVTLKDLLACNGLTEKSLLKAGQVLRIPPSVAKAPPDDKDSAAPELPVPSPAPSKVEDPRKTGPVASRGKLKWPIESSDISYMQGKLYGVVIAGKKSETIQSLTAGTVVSAGPYRGFGRVVIVQADENYLYVYGGGEELSVKEGEKVAPGSELGRLGVDALSNRAQLYFIVYKDNKAIDPVNAPRS